MMSLRYFIVSYTIKKDTKVKVQYRPELSTGTVLQVAEASGSYTQIDIVFEKDGKRFLETFPQNLLTPVADIFQRYQNNESDHPTDFFLKQLACQLPLENSGGELSNSKTDLLPHHILLTHQIISAHRRKFAQIMMVLLISDTGALVFRR